MSTPNPTTEETPILQEMQICLRVLREQLALPTIQRGTVLRAMNRFRVMLRKIYGAESQQLAHLPVIRSEEFTGDIRQLLTTRLQLAESVLSTLQGMAGLASGGRRIFIGHGRSPLWRELKDFV